MCRVQTYLSRNAHQEIAIVNARHLRNSLLCTFSLPQTVTAFPTRRSSLSQLIFLNSSISRFSSGPQMMVCSRGTQTGRNLTFALLGLTLAESTKKVWQRSIPFIRRKLRCYFCQRYSTVSIYLNPLLPSISLHILYTVPYTFTKGFDKENLFNNRR